METTQTKSNGKAKKEDVMPKDEQLKHDIDLVFSYARCHSTNINPHNEQELIHIINLKAELHKRLKLT